MISYCKKNPAVALAIVTAIFTFIGFLLGKAYADGCRDTKVEAVTYGQMQLQDDVKDIKKDVGELKTDVAVMKGGIKDIKDWIKPNKEAFNAVQNK